jgi:NAD(P)-dependent dehydrogenase (short-subunit alcohol dehydrogenase family)
MDNLQDKVVLITGGAGGIGRATALAAAEAGAVVVVADLNEEDGTALASQLGGHFFPVDVTSLEANEAMVAFALEKAGGLDHVFLNAGIASGTNLGDEFSLGAYRRAMGVNLDGVVFGVQAALPALRARGGGSIVATASLAGLTGMPMDVIYTANKHAVVGIARSLGPALEGEGIRVNAVCPGFTESALTAGLEEGIAQYGVPLMPASDVASVVMGLFTGDMAGEVWFVQPGRTGAFEFRHVPGPRLEPASSEEAPS